MPHPVDRRTFLAGLGVAAGATSLPPFLRQVQAAPVRHRAASEEWDLSWVADLDKARHKQLFDMGSLDWGTHVTANYLKAFREVMNLGAPDVVAVVGIASTAFPMNAGHALWAKYQLGEKWEVRDRETGTWATRNIFDADPAPRGFRPDDAVTRLVAQGTIFWQCHNSLMGISEGFAAQANTSPQAMYEELKAGLLPHVKIVPAHTLLVGLVQERGCTYEKI